MRTLAQRLRPGDTIGLIAPASAPPDPKTIDEAITAIEEMGFKVKLARNVRKRWGFLAGSDRDRAGDIMQMFADPKVHGILCVRGGYGAARLLSLLDYRVIRKNPKVFAGYSDITALHCAFLKEAGLVTFHAPMATSDFAKKDYPDFSRQSFLAVVTKPEPFGSIRRGYKKKTVSILRPGIASGELIGGNICILCTMIGTRFQPSFKNKILFFEDVDEEPFRFDRMLTHLMNVGVLQQVAGIAIGINADCEDPKAKKVKEYRQTLEDVFRDRLLPLKVPVVMGLPFGHIPFNATIPVGTRATLDAIKGDLILAHPAVR
jgi:muramoyltetrapeptide carboxypeptidase